MNYVESFNFYGVDAKEIPCIKGSGAPTSSTAGAVGCFYMDTQTGIVYKCVAAASGAYTWKDVTAQPKFELLETITVGDTDLGTVVRDVPNLEAVALVVYSPKASANVNVGLRVHYTDLNTKKQNFWTLANLKAAEAANPIKSQHLLYKRFGMWYYEYNSQVPTWSASFQTQPAYCFVMDESNFTHVEKITIIAGAGLPVGTTIKIYGVRRYEN